MTQHNEVPGSHLQFGTHPTHTNELYSFKFNFGHHFSCYLSCLLEENERCVVVGDSVECDPKPSFTEQFI